MGYNQYTKVNCILANNNWKRYFLKTPISLNNIIVKYFGINFTNIVQDYYDKIVLREIKDLNRR